MKETWKHKVIREGLEKGWSFMRISKEHKLSVSAIYNEVENDMDLKIMIL